MGKMRKKIKYGPIIHGDRPEIDNYPGTEKFNLWKYDRHKVRVIKIEDGYWLEVGSTENARIVAGVTKDSYFTLLCTPFGEGKDYLKQFIHDFAHDALDLDTAKEYYQKKMLFNINTGEVKEYGSV